ncbi:NAD(P)/FAD-dependent oxidoreductase [Thalassospiraceae bacterium LMO-JJ14]|nr:NAD(P)/FAD-dependent oxidoreductase [Thalassospiraceae bacterium LMO-JJ14]
MTQNRPLQFDVIVIGAGAAGLMCALTAGARGRRVLLLDHADAAGKKILISGGGRCNFTNTHCRPDNFISTNRHFCKSALARYTPADFIQMVEKHDIAWHEKTLGQLFCDGRAGAVVEMLLRECRAGAVDIRLNHNVTDVTRAERFKVATDKGDFEAASLVLASGGLSIPKMGASDFAHRTARRFGLTLIHPRPALVPLKVGADDLALMNPLSGVATECIARHGKTSFREAMLLTHRGLSGPAILQISSYWREGDAISLNIIPDTDAAGYLLAAKQSGAKAKPGNVLGRLLPARLATALAAADLPDRPIGEITDRDLSQFGHKLNNWQVVPTGSEGFAKAEVTLGGIDTKHLSSQTMEAKNVPGLFIIGEAVDVTGWLGGYNFQWAWASGRAAGEAV